MLQDKYEILYRYFGYTSFRDGQVELIDAQLSGRDVFGIMPTGGGKSLCYQIPALMMEGITLVVSPLISLMKDQVSSLKRMGIAAAYINSSLSPEQIRLVLKNLQMHKYKIVYIAPERLLTENFVFTIRKVPISMLAVDEAHCISQWGQDFRPTYLRIAGFLKLLKDQCGYRPVVSAFTATATYEVRDDVERVLDLQNPLRVVTGYDRPNLRFEVLKPKNKPLTLRRLISSRLGKSGIIYCATRKEVEKVCSMLQDDGVSSTRYHAGLPDEERRSNQDDFVYDRSKVMVATNAFGMGINKSNVSYVIHYNMPQSIEAYYQEAGRAGRDGENADCILLYSLSDVRTAKYLIQQPVDNDMVPAEERERIVKRELIRLDAMIGYCNTEQCLRGYILEYFGQKHDPICKHCANCEVVAVEHDITDESRKILSCVQRVYDFLGYSLGITLIVRILHGSREKRIMELKLNELSTYGIMREIPRSEIRAMVDLLVRRGYIQVDPVYGGIILTRDARNVLFEDERVTMIVRAEAIDTVKSNQHIPDKAPEDELLEILKGLRLSIAREEKVPAYVIFSNATLRDMAVKSPTTVDDFLNVSGVGKYKAEHYGSYFIDAIKKYKGGELDA